SILVLGAGELGLSILRALITSPPVKSETSTVTVLLRPGSSSVTKIRDLSQQIRIIEGDVGAPVNELAGLFGGFDAVVCATGYGAPLGTQRMIAEAVRKAGELRGEEGGNGRGRKRLRFIPWQFGVDYDVVGHGSQMPLFEEQLGVREFLRSKEVRGVVDWVIVSTGMFTSFLFEEEFGVVRVEGWKEGRRGRVTALGGWRNRVTVTGVGDIGVLTARALFEPELHERIVYTAGQTFEYGFLADLLQEMLFGNEPERLERVVWTAEELERRVRETGDMLERYRLLFAQGKGVSWDTNRTWNVRLGWLADDLETFVRR
ncbi:hypothetical protein M501DRAFT_922085, partial [Patellaria atrata CBS 101060]